MIKSLYNITRILALCTTSVVLTVLLSYAGVSNTGIYVSAFALGLCWHFVFPFKV